MRHYRKCYQEARLARSLGISVIPPMEDGSKRPLDEPIRRSCEHPDCAAQRAADKKTGWTHRQHRRAGESVLSRWYLGEHRDGIGFVCGEVSGGLLLFEFEGRAVSEGTFDRFLELAEEIGLRDLIEEIRHGYEDESPSGGIHWLIYCDEAKSERLASIQLEGNDGKARWAPLIETKGEGGFAIGAPTAGSVHPSGKAWKRVQGGLESIVYLDPGQLDDLYALARNFDQKPRRERKPSGKASAKTGGRLPGDDFNETATWGEVLEPHGWEYSFTAADGRSHWSRPGKNPEERRRPSRRTANNSGCSLHRPPSTRIRITQSGPPLPSSIIPMLMERLTGRRRVGNS